MGRLRPPDQAFLPLLPQAPEQSMECRTSRAGYNPSCKKDVAALFCQVERVAPHQRIWISAQPMQRDDQGILLSLVTLEETNTAYGRSWFVSAKFRSSVGRAGPAPGRHAPLARRRVLQLPLAAQGRSQRTTRCRQFRQGRSSRERHRAGAALAGQGNSPRPAAPGCVVPGVSGDFYCRICIQFSLLRSLH